MQQSPTLSSRISRNLFGIARPNAAGGSVATDELVNDPIQRLYQNMIKLLQRRPHQPIAVVHIILLQTATGCTNQIEGSYGYSAYSYKVAN